MIVFTWWLIAAIICAQHVDSAFTIEEPCKVYDKDFQCESSSETTPSVNAENPEPDCGSDLVQKTLALIAEGDAVINKQLEEFGNSTEAVLMIGKTGTGKSTLTFFLAGNNSAMISYRTGVDKYSIKDCNGKIGGSGIISQTTFPELVTDPLTQTSFYDYPGFFDTRAVCIEIANAFYMLKVARSIPNTKFILVVDHFSVGGRGRDDLVGLLKSVINFIPNIEKFSSNLGLVATKVTQLTANDTEFIPYIKTFLAEIQLDLASVFHDEEELRKATFILETLLVDGKIGVFRTPNDCGPLDTIPLMQQNKRNLHEMIRNNLSYVKTDNRDFGVSLSKDALYEITNLRASISADVLKLLQQLSNAVIASMKAQFKCEGSTNCDIIIQNLQTLYNDQYFYDGYSSESLYRNRSTTDALLNVSAVFVLFLNSETFQNISVSLKTQGEYLEFLQTLDNNQADVLPLVSPLKELKPKLTEEITILRESISADVLKVLRQLSNEVLASMQAQFKCEGSQNCEFLIQNLQSLYNDQYYNDGYSSESLYRNVSTAEMLANVSAVFFQLINYETSQNISGSLKTQGEYLEFLQTLDNNQANVFPLLAPLKELKPKITQEITILRESISADVLKVLQQLSNEVLASIKTQFKCQGSTNCEILIQNLQTLYSDQYYYDDYSSESLYHNRSTTDALANVSAVFYQFLDVTTSQNISNVLKYQGNYLELLQTLDSKITELLPLLAPLRALKPQINLLIQINVKPMVSQSLVNSMNETCLRLFDNALIKFSLSGDIFAKTLDIENYSTVLHDKIAFLKTELQENLDIDYFTEVAIIMLKDLGCNSSDDGIKAIQAQKVVLDLLVQAGVETSITPPDHSYWLSPFTLILSLTENERAWCQFLTNLFENLSEKTHQVDDNRYKDWWESHHPITSLADKTLEQFWSYFSLIPAVGNLSFVNALTILQKDFSTKIGSLNVLLNTTLLSDVACTTSADVCDCRGIYVSLQKVHSKCKPNSATQLRVSAYHTLYLDTKITGTDYNSVTNLDIVLVAPFTWSQSMYSINLNGASGAAQGPILGQGTEEGNAGLPGGKAGNLYALVETLGTTVSVNGGKGGSGQNGQKGLNGIDGKNKSVTETGKWIPKSECYAHAGGDVDLTDILKPYSCSPNMNVRCHAAPHAFFYIKGHPGTPGHQGAHGGKSGLGGLGGRIYQPFWTRNSNTNTTFRQKKVDGSKNCEWAERSINVGQDGSLGEIGAGGSGGAGGNVGPTYVAEIDDAYCGSCVEKRCKFKSSHLESANDRQPDGSKGIDGASSKTQSKPLPQTFNPCAFAEKFISNFKTSSGFLITNEFFKSNITAFHSKLNAVKISC